MRPFLFLALMTAAPALAQSPLFVPTETTYVRPAEPHWRVAPAIGVSAVTLDVIVAAGVERTVTGPLSAGGRIWTVVDSDLGVSAGRMEAVGMEALASVSTGARWMDLRASTGLGVGLVDYSRVGVCTIDACTIRTFEDPLVYLPAAVGLDVYPFPGVGVGIEYRVWFSTATPEASDQQGLRPVNASLETGLRIRLAR